MGGNDLPEKKQKRKPVLWRNTIAPAYFMFGWNPGVGVKQCQLVKNVENRINGLSIGIKGHFGMDPETNGVVKAIC